MFEDIIIINNINVINNNSNENKISMNSNKYNNHNFKKIPF